MTDQNLEKQKNIAILGVSIIILFPIICLIFYFLKLKNAISAVGIIINGISSLLLVVLYFRQTNILEEQKETQDTLAYLEHSSNLVVNEWVVSRNEIIFNLSNIGDGNITNLRYIMVCEPITDSSTGDDEFRNWLSNVATDEFNTVPLRRDEEEKRTARNILKANESAKFKNSAILPMETRNDIEKNTKFDYIYPEKIKELENSKRVRVAVILEYDDPLQTGIRVILWNMEVIVDEIDSLEDLFGENSTSTLPSKGKVYPANLERWADTLHQHGAL